jgi:hypothetical protein
MNVDDDDVNTPTIPFDAEEQDGPESTNTKRESLVEV